MNKISVIIPAYNVEPYIGKCLDSVINQTYKNLEILLINDGSADNSGKICDEYAKKDNRIRVLHKENGGLSSALNVGLENFTGDYLGFVDSDDWIEPDMFEVLHKTLKCNNVPISVSNYFRDTDTETIEIRNKAQIPNNEVIPTEDILLYSLKRDSYTGFCGYVWNKLYSAEIIRGKSLSFDEKVKFGMDALFFTQIIISGNYKGAYIDKPLYHYYQRDTSLSYHNPLKNRSDTFFVYESIINMLESSGYGSVSIWAKRFYCYFASMYAEIAIKNNDIAILTDMQEEMKRYLSEYIETNRDFPDRIHRINYLLNVKPEEIC